MSLYFGQQKVHTIIIPQSTEHTIDISVISSDIQNAYTAIENKGGTIPEVKGSANLSASIDSISTTPPHVYAVQSDIEWNDEWQQKGLSGTTFDVVVGDNKAPSLSITIVVGNISSTDPCTVDWGDGTTTVMAKTTSETRLYHAYEQAGHYVLNVDDKVKHIYFMTTIPVANTLANTIILNTRWAIRCLRQIGSKITNMYSMCYALTWCNSDDGGYPAYLPAIPVNVTSLDCAFYNLSQYKLPKIPRIDHLTKCTSVRQTFRAISKSAFDIQKLPPNVTTAEGVYYDCRQVKYIPYDVFEFCTNLTNAYGVFYNCYIAHGEYPKINHLTKVTTFSCCFYDCLTLGEGYELPELPYAPNCTSISYMFGYNYGCNGVKPLNIAEHLPKVTTMARTFMYCEGLRTPIELPPTISAANGLEYTFCGCYSMTGEFPYIPENYTGSMYQTFYNCQNVSGEIKPFPEGVTVIYNTYGNCYKATGRLPALGHIKKLSGSDSARATFCGCTNVTLPPETFFNPEVMNSANSTATNFWLLFGYCSNLISADFDLSQYTKITSTQEMYRECISMRHCNMSYPPNVTNVYCMWYYCTSLEDNIPQWSSKITNASGIYYCTTNLKPMLDAEGNIETDASKIYNSKITSYSTLAQGSSGKVQKQFYDALVASGKSGTLYGNVNANWE